MSGRKVTLREYIDKCRQFNPQFDYSDLGFITISGQFVTPICKKHGKFKFNARGLCTKSIRCPECDRENRFNSFIQKAKEIHGEKYKYDQSTYITNKIPIKITCLIHGDFLLGAWRSFKGMGMLKMFQKIQTFNRRMGIESNAYIVTNMIILKQI